MGIQNGGSMSEEISERFAYDSLDEETRVFVLHTAAETHGLVKRTVQDAIQIGRNLLAVKQRLPHGQFLPWLAAEFGMSRMTAHRFMQIAEKFGDKCNTALHLPIRVLS